MLETENNSEIPNRFEDETRSLEPVTREPLAVSLPFELLTAIFKAGVHISPHNDISLPLLATWVCHRWRHVAISSPHIWTEINISGPSSQISKLIPLSIERSTSCLINISIKLRSRSTSNFTRDIIDLIFPHISRCRRFILKVSEESDSREIIQRFTTATLPSLEHIEVFVDHADSWDAKPSHFKLFNDHPALRTLKLHGICSACAPPLIGLTTLHIDAYHPSYSDLKDLFAALPCLAELALRRFWNSVPVGEQYPVIEVNSLRAFAISLGPLYADSGDGCLISHITMPNLTYLEIVRQNKTPNLVELFPFYTENTQHKHLRTLCLNGLDPENIDIQFLRAFPMITDFQLINVFPISVGHRINFPAGMLPWRQLQYITFKDIGEIDLEWLTFITQGITGDTECRVRIFRSTSSLFSVRDVEEILQHRIKFEVVDHQHEGLIKAGFFMGEMEEDDDYDDDLSDYDYDSPYEWDDESDYDDEGEDEDDEGLDGVEGYFHH